MALTTDQGLAAGAAATEVLNLPPLIAALEAAAALPSVRVTGLVVHLKRDDDGPVADIRADEQLSTASSARILADTAATLSAVVAASQAVLAGFGNAADTPVPGSPGEPS